MIREHSADAAAVIGIDFGGTKIEAALAARDGAVLRRERLEMLADRGPAQALERTAEAVGRLEQVAHAEYGLEVRGYGAVAPGVIQPDRILLTPNLPGWQDLALARELARVLGLERAPAVMNDVHAGALAELRHGALRGADPGLYISLGTGIAAAVTVAGRVLSGAHQAAGEIGYADPGPVTGRDRVSGPAVLEELVGGKGLGERAGELLGTELTAAQLFARTDAASLALVHSSLETLARTIAGFCTVLDPEAVVLGGGMMASAAVILPALRARLEQSVPFPPQVRAARFTENASLHGALSLALDQLASPGRPAGLHAAV
jgi:glucokinase